MNRTVGRQPGTRSPNGEQSQRTTNRRREPLAETHKLADGTGRQNPNQPTVRFMALRISGKCRT